MVSEETSLSVFSDENSRLDLDENSSPDLDSLSDLDVNSTLGLDENDPPGFTENSLPGLDSPLSLDESSLLALDEDENSPPGFPPGLDEMLTQIRCQVDTMVPVNPDSNQVIIPLVMNSTDDFGIDDMPVVPPVSPASIPSICDDEELLLTDDLGINDMSVDDMSVVSPSTPSICDDEELYPASISDKEEELSDVSVVSWDQHKAELQTIRESLENLYIIKDRVRLILHRLPTQCFIDLVNRQINISDIMKFTTLSDEGAKIIEDAVRAYLNEAIPYTKV